MSGIPHWAYPGAKVVCVLDFRTSRTVDDRGYRGLPTVGCVYLVREAYVCSYGVPVVTLEEFARDHYFDLQGFRPLITEQDDLEAHFNELLKTPQRVTVRERA